MEYEITRLLIVAAISFWFGIALATWYIGRDYK